MDRQMTTGNHTVRDIYCVKCGETLGWKYVRIFSKETFRCGGRSMGLCQDRAYETSQKYKEGKYILERNLLTDVQ